MQTSISFLSSAYSFDKTIEQINNSIASAIHVDVMDGLFINHVTHFTKEQMQILKNSPKPKEIHLMTLHLKKYIDLFSHIQPEYIIYEYEATVNHKKIINYIKEKQIKAGIAVGPLTDINVLIPYLKNIDMILVMGVIPGAGGQAFLKQTVDRVIELQEIREKNHFSFLISVDGGINEETIQLLNNTKLDRVVTGSYVCKSPNFNEKIKNLIGKIK